MIDEEKLQLQLCTYIPRNVQCTIGKKIKNSFTCNYYLIFILYSKDPLIPQVDLAPCDIDERASSVKQHEAFCQIEETAKALILRREQLTWTIFLTRRGEELKQRFAI